MSLQRRNSRDSTPSSSPAHAPMSISGISPHTPTSDDLRLKSSMKTSHTPRSHRVTMDKTLREEEQEWDDEPDPELFARDRRDRDHRPRIDISPSRRPSESKHRRRPSSLRRTCTNKRVAMGTCIIVLIILMIALTIRIRQVPTIEGGTTTTTTGAGAGIPSQLNVPAAPLTSTSTTTCPPPPECPAPAPVLATNCPICPSLDTSEFDHLRHEYNSLKMKYDQLQSQQRTQETALQAAQAEIVSLKQGSTGQQSIRPLETATAPPSTSKKLIGAGDPYEVTGEDADIPLESHLVAWNYCLGTNGKLFGTHDLCPNRANSEQGFQLAFYDQWDKNGRVVPMTKRPSYPSCIQRIPNGYVFPPKHRPPLPHKVGVEHWGNFGNDITKLEDLIVFNPTALKNLYHFDAARYDHDFEHHIRFGAKFIPLASKVRLALDVGSGGGSFGLWLKQKYDIQTLSIAFPDWPYCEYISMRGNLCMYVDAFHAMPFAKQTFDLVHVSWVYHSMDPPDLEKAFLEVYRITRPGGYMWLQDGHSRAQVETQQRLIKLLGLVKLFEHQTPHRGETSFGNNPYQLQWWTILLKPIREVDYTSNVTSCHLP